MELAIAVFLWTLSVSTALLTIFVGNLLAAKTDLAKARAAHERTFTS